MSSSLPLHIQYPNHNIDRRKYNKRILFDEELSSSSTIASAASSTIIFKELKFINRIIRNQRPLRKHCLAPIIIAWIVIIHLYLGFQRQGGNLSNIREASIVASTMNEKEKSARTIIGDSSSWSAIAGIRTISNRNESVGNEEINNYNNVTGEYGHNNNMPFSSLRGEDEVVRKA